MRPRTSSRRPGRLSTDNSDRSALGKGAHRAHRADCSPDVDRARNHRLLGFAAARGVQDFEKETMLLEDSRALAELSDGRVPIAPLAGGNLERVLRGSL